MAVTDWNPDGFSFPVWRGPTHDSATSTHAPRPSTRRPERAHPEVLPPRRKATRRPLPHGARPTPESQVRDYFLHLKNDKRFATGSSEHRLQRHQVLLHPHRATRLEDAQDGPRPQAKDTPRCVDDRRGATGSSTPSGGQTSRPIFWTVYSLGLRLGEGLHLQVGDIDSQRMLVHVHLGKGSKDRYVPLPQRTLTVLRQHWVTHRDPVWLFPATRPTSARRGGAATAPCSVRACSRPCPGWWSSSSFRKAVSIHTLAAQLRHPLARSRCEPAADPALPGSQFVADHHGLSPCDVAGPRAGACPDRGRDGGVADADRRRRVAAVRPGLSRAVWRGDASGAQEGAAGDHGLPHRRAGDRAVRVPVVR